MVTHYKHGVTTRIKRRDESDLKVQSEARIYLDNNRMFWLLLADRTGRRWLLIEFLIAAGDRALEREREHGGTHIECLSDCI